MKLQELANWNVAGRGGYRNRPVFLTPNGTKVVRLGGWVLPGDAPGQGADGSKIPGPGRGLRTLELAVWHGEPGTDWRLKVCGLWLR